MKNKVDKFKLVPLHPILFGIYPVLINLAHNVEQVKLIAGIRPLVVLFVGTTVFLIGLGLLLRNRYRAAVICSLFLILFFSYGHAYDFLNQTHAPWSSLGRHRYLFAAWISLFILGLWWIRRLRNMLQSATPILNVIALISISFPIFIISSFQLRMRQAYAQRLETVVTIDSRNPMDQQFLPDIYYIILDAYTRDDVLREIYDYDNTPFLYHLTELGFYVARCSQSNYAQTELSMAASLNMEYLEILDEDFIEGNTNKSGIVPFLKYGEVRRLLEEMGYTVVAFETGFYWIQWEDADIYLSPVRFGSVSKGVSWEGISSFEVMVFESSAARILTDTDISRDLLSRIFPDMNYPGKVVRERTELVLDHLKMNRMRKIQSPKFVYAHIIAPHPPYVFGPNGEIAEDDDDFGYIDQVTYISQRILELVEDIIQESETPPVIILQGDHGLRHIPAERVAILNAYYLPGGGDQMLYPSITPVNTFRVIFNYYFGAAFGVLEDRSYFSTYEMPFDYEEVLNNREGCSGE